MTRRGWFATLLAPVVARFTPKPAPKLNIIWFDIVQDPSAPGMADVFRYVSPSVGGPQ